jgi:hypothetical protein
MHDNGKFSVQLRPNLGEVSRCRKGKLDKPVTHACKQAVRDMIKDLKNRVDEIVNK